MRASDISVGAVDDRCELRATIHADTEWVNDGRPFELWYRFPGEYAEHLSARNGDPFLAALLFPAMTLRESLEIDAPVSPRLMRATAASQDLYTSWTPELRPVEISTWPAVAGEGAHDGVAERTPACGTGLFFSMGVDSYYSLFKNDRHRPGGEASVTHLINVFGFDLYQWERARYPRVRANMQHAARTLGKTLVDVDTNLRELTDQMADWTTRYHGAALASVALALQSVLGRVFIAASTAFEHLIPWGSHPHLDPLWSTESTTFVHDGCEATRLTKVRAIAQAPLVLETLRVCAADFSEDVYNCGRCSKCLRTMIALEVAGTLSRCRTLPGRADPENVRAMRITSDLEAKYLHELRQALVGTGADDALVNALSSVLDA